MTKTKYTEEQLKELYARACASPYPDNYDPDGSDTMFYIVRKLEMGGNAKRGSKEFREDNDPLTQWAHTKGWVEDNTFNPVRIISPKNATYSDLPKTPEKS